MKKVDDLLESYMGIRDTELGENKKHCHCDILFANRILSCVPSYLVLPSYLDVFSQDDFKYWCKCMSCVEMDWGITTDGYYYPFSVSVPLPTVLPNNNIVFKN